MRTKTLALGIAAIVIIAIGIIAITSGGGDDSPDASETDGAFIAEMKPHHESAIEMANVALTESEHPEVKELAQAIVATQAAEVDELETIHDDLFGVAVAEGDHGTLGMQDHEMGMDMEASTLAGERPFDRAFIDMMIPHHQGAIRMARVQLAAGENARLTEISEAIIAGQAREIEEMNSWRAEWYGSASPSGGVPAEEEAPSHEMMGH
ncbi:MAG: DUF305 domain-containing protein [Solirubrobacterales bacterium]